MGNIDNLLANISDKPFRSSFNVTQAFYQIGMTPESKGVTFFVTRPSGSCIMKFNRSIQGSKTATSVFTRAMEITLQGLEEAASSFVDDLCAHSKTMDQHIADLEAIFQRLLDSNIKLAPQKANFLAAKIKYLGMDITANSYSMTDKKLDAIKTLPTPTSRKQLISQFALMQYYKKFIPAFADLMHPFRHLLSDKQEYV
jgi:hypothetical protein